MPNKKLRIKCPVCNKAMHLNLFKSRLNKKETYSCHKSLTHDDVILDTPLKQRVKKEQ